MLWNQGHLLSVGVLGYLYSGGAHGMYATSAHSMYARTGRALRFADIFRPAAETELVPVLDRAVRRTLRLPATAPLDETLFVEHMPVTHNFYLTRGGAVFIYPPYAVASFAQGEIQVFVPLSETQPLLKPGLPVAGGGVR